jgi:hypothetical protein
MTVVRLGNKRLLARGGGGKASWYERCGTLEWHWTVACSEMTDASCSGRKEDAQVTDERLGHL